MRSIKEARSLKQATYLSVQLRESVPYLRDARWRETATLLTVAADEIEQLRARVMELEGRYPIPERSQRGRMSAIGHRLISALSQKATLPFRLAS